jgi:predicted permease
MLISRMGAASLACGLLAVGAALTLVNVGTNAALITYNTLIKLIVMPLVAIGMAKWLGVSGIYFDMVVLFGALPTAVFVKKVVRFSKRLPPRFLATSDAPAAG